MFSKEYIFKIEFDRVSEVFCSFAFQIIDNLWAANLKRSWSKSSSWITNNSGPQKTDLRR